MMSTVLIVFLIIILLIIAYTFKIRKTPHGRLNFTEAVLLKFLFKPINRFKTASEEQRSIAVAFKAKFPEKLVAIEGVSDRNVTSGGIEIPIRIYTPSTEKNLPVMVYFHGGGWVIGSIESHEASCRKIAKLSNIVVVSVDYRLAPEHKFPAAFDDAYAVTQWVAENAVELGVNVEKLAIGGDSAGANLATAVCLKARDEQGPQIKFQLLIYPVTDVSRLDRESQKNFSEGYLLSVQDMDYFRQAYARDEQDYLNPLMSPLLATSHANLPPTFLLTAEFDPLRSEGIAYVEKLRESGVDVEHKDYAGTIHAFFGLDNLKQGSIAMNDAASALRKYLH